MAGKTFCQNGLNETTLPHIHIIRQYLYPFTKVGLKNKNQNFVQKSNFYVHLNV